MADERRGEWQITGDRRGVSTRPVRREAQIARPEETRERWRQWAQSILAAENEWMILDTETTGISRDADILEFAAVTPSGRPLADCLIRPVGRIPQNISALTGITNEMVMGAPRFVFAYSDQLQPLLTTRRVLAYNVSFDVRLLRSNIQRHCRREWQPVGQDCLMRAYAAYRGERFPAGHSMAGRVRPHTLENACRQMSLRHDDAHRALNDCIVSAQLLQAMAHRA